MANDLTLDSLDFDTDDNSTAQDVTPQNEPTSTEPTEPVTEPQSQEPTQPLDAVSEYLKTIGIADPEKIKFEGDDGKVSEKPWKDLTEEEKLNILKTPNVKQYDASAAATYGLDDSETQLINYLRQNNISPDEYAQGLQEEGAQKALSQNKQYSVDSLSDDELYLSDLQLRTNNTMTDEELSQALSNAKSNPDSYKKQIDGLRSEYKTLEDQQYQQQQAEQNAARQEQYQQFSNAVIDSIDNLNSIGDLDISMDNNEKDQLAEFILGQDGAGVNYLTKALNDPNALVAASWFLLHGSDLFSEIENYVSSEVKRAKSVGREEAIKEMKGKSNPQVVVTSRNNPQASTSNVNSIDDINFD